MRSVVQLSFKCHGKCDLSLWPTSPRIDPLKRARFLEVSVRDLQPFDHDRRDQVQAGPAVNQHLAHPEVAYCWRNQQRQTPNRGSAIRLVLSVKDEGRAGPL